MHQSFSMTKKFENRILTISCLCFLFTLYPEAYSYASGDDGRKSVDPGELINHHISNSHSWEISHGLTVHLPVILYSGRKGLEIFSSANFYNEHHEPVPYKGYVLNHGHITLEDGGYVLDISITKNVLFMLLNAVVMILVFSSVARGYKKNEGHAPKGIQSFFEPIILFIRDEVVRPSIGSKYERFLPYMLTLFFFIWFGNLMGLLPAAANMTGNISFTLVLALLTMIITFFLGKKTYWMHIFNPLGNTMGWGAKTLLYIVLIPIEVIGLFTKPFSLMIRLFANITAGHIILLSILSLGFIMESVVVGVAGALFAVIMFFLELLVAIMQAYVFTLLSAIYFGAAVEEGH